MADLITRSVWYGIIEKASRKLGKIRWAVVEEICETWDDAAQFVTLLEEHGCVIDGPVPDRAKKALKERGVNL